MVCETVNTERAIGGAGSNLLGWKAMPFALDDLDSNYLNCQKEHAGQIVPISEAICTFVSMLGEEVDAILTAARYVKLTPRA